MNVNERIQLRDILFNILLDNKCIIKRKSIYILYKKHLNILLKDNIIIKELYKVYINEFRSKEEAVFNLLHHDDYTNHMCPICKTNICLFYNINYVYTKTCGSESCIKARIGSDEAKQKRSNTNMKKYGVNNPFESEEIKEQIRQTCIQKFGVDNPAKSELIKDKIKQSIMKHYNVEYALQSKEILDKMKQTMLERYNVEFALQNSKFLQKAQDTCLERFGTKNIFQSQEFINKVIESNLERFGVKHQSQVHITNYDIWIDDDKFIQFIKNEYNKTKAFLLLKNIAKFFNVDSNTIKYRIVELNLLDYFYIRDSVLELDFKNFLDFYNIDHKRHHIIFGDNNLRREIDFLVNNIGFEINDIVTHNSIGLGCIEPKDQYYHKHKTNLANLHNIRLIHIWEWELRNKLEWDRLSNWIINSLLNQSKIQLNLEIDCNDDIRLVDKEDRIEFLNQYSIISYQEEYDNYVGIYYNNELIELLLFKDDIVNICIKNGYKLIKGTNDVIQSYMKCFHLSNIFTYIDLSKFTGKSLEDIGFKLVDHIEPQIIWCNKEMNHLNSINEDNSGYISIYDCGHNIYEMELD